MRVDKLMIALLLCPGLFLGACGETPARPGIESRNEEARPGAGIEIRSRQGERDELVAEIVLHERGSLRMIWSNGLESSLHEVGPTPAGAPLVLRASAKELVGKEVLDQLVQALWGQAVVAGIRAEIADADERVARELLVETEFREMRGGGEGLVRTRSHGYFAPLPGTRSSSTTITTSPVTLKGQGTAVLGTWIHRLGGEEVSIAGGTEEAKTEIKVDGRKLDEDEARGRVLTFSLGWEPAP
ncbi:MAG: hypothetical protein H6807_17020 [Planctomycetes bacterium]|nr:hypothetical protein [Planctomycetota bacterium]